MALLRSCLAVLCACPVIYHARRIEGPTRSFPLYDREIPTVESILSPENNNENFDYVSWYNKWTRTTVLQAQPYEARRLKHNDYEGIADAIARDGYAVVANVVGNREALAQLRASLWRSVRDVKEPEEQQANEGQSRDPPTPPRPGPWDGNVSLQGGTLSEWQRLSSFSTGFGMPWSMAHSECFWRARALPRLSKIFGSFFGGTDDLIVSFDTGSIFPPAGGPMHRSHKRGGKRAKGKKQFYSFNLEDAADYDLIEGWLHTDQNPLWRPGRQTIQSFVTLYDQDELTGGFVVYPGSHHCHDWLSAAAMWRQTMKKVNTNFPHEAALTQYHHDPELYPGHPDGGWGGLGDIGDNFNHTAPLPLPKTGENFVQLNPRDVASSRFMVPPHAFRGVVGHLPDEELERLEREADERAKWAPGVHPFAQDAYYLRQEVKRDSARDGPRLLTGLRAGDAVFWDSRVAHMNAPPPYNVSSRLNKCASDEAREDGEQTWLPARAVVYVSMTPRAWASDEVLLRRQQAFRDAEPCTHWPFLVDSCLGVKNSIAPPTAEGATSAVRSLLPLSPPPTAARLSGLYPGSGSALALIGFTDAQLQQGRDLALRAASETTASAAVDDTDGTTAAAADRAKLVAEYAQNASDAGSWNRENAPPKPPWCDESHCYNGSVVKAHSGWGFADAGDCDFVRLWIEAWPYWKGRGECDEACESGREPRSSRHGVDMDD